MIFINWVAVTLVLLNNHVMEIVAPVPWNNILTECAGEVRKESENQHDNYIDLTCKDFGGRLIHTQIRGIARV